MTPVNPSVERAVRFPLTFELYRSGRAAPYKPTPGKEYRPDKLLHSMVVARNGVPLEDPGRALGVKYPQGYHWRVTDADGNLHAVAVNQRFPMHVLIALSNRGYGPVTPTFNIPTGTRTFPRIEDREFQLDIVGRLSALEEAGLPVLRERVIRLETAVERLENDVATLDDGAQKLEERQDGLRDSLLEMPPEGSMAMRGTVGGLIKRVGALEEGERDTAAHHNSLRKHHDTLTESVARLQERVRAAERQLPAASRDNLFELQKDLRSRLAALTERVAKLEPDDDEEFPF